MSKTCVSAVYKILTTTFNAIPRWYPQPNTPNFYNYTLPKHFIFLFHTTQWRLSASLSRSLSDWAVSVVCVLLWSAKINHTPHNNHQSSAYRMREKRLICKPIFICQNMFLTIQRRKYGGARLLQWSVCVCFLFPILFSLVCISFSIAFVCLIGLHLASLQKKKKSY